MTCNYVIGIKTKKKGKQESERLESLLEADNVASHPICFVF